MSLIIITQMVMIVDLNLLQESTKEIVESLAYTIKEINAVTGCGLYTVAGLCCPALLPTVQEVWSKVYVNSDILFAAVKDGKNGS